jgi:hypothetical protein
VCHFFLTVSAITQIQAARLLFDVFAPTAVRSIIELFLDAAGHNTLFTDLS